MNKSMERAQQSLKIDQEVLWNLQTPPVPSFVNLPAEKPRLRLVRVDEIAEENPSAYRNALANVYASINSEDHAQFLYVIEGRPGGVAMYFGVLENTKTADSHEAMKNLTSALEGQLPGIHLNKVDEEEMNGLLHRLQQSHKHGLVMGIPTSQDEKEESEEDFQGIERLVRTLSTGSSIDSPNVAHWQLVIVFQALTHEECRQQLDSAFDLASQLSLLARTTVQASQNSNEQRGVTHSDSTAEGTSKSRADTKGKSEGASESRSSGSSQSQNSSSSSSGTNTGVTQGKNFGTNTGVTLTSGTSSTRTTGETFNLSHSEGNTLGFTHELVDKRIQYSLEHLEKQLIPRLQKGITKGLLSTAIHLFAENPSTYQRLKNTVRATFQGSEATLTPLQVVDMAFNSNALQLPALKDSLSPTSALFHSLREEETTRRLGTLLTVEELSLIAGLPRRELPGLKRRKTVDFAVDLPRLEATEALELGEVIDRGRRQPNNSVRISKANLSSHVFVTGVTGAGKTTTCLNLLIESGLSFLVVEPAKTEYRALGANLPDVEYYRPNGDIYRSLRINPFALIHSGQSIKSHASMLRNTFAAVFPMEASMPYLIEQAILRSYEEKGWDLTDNTHLSIIDPFDPISRAWPTMSDMIRQLDRLIPEQGMGREFEEKYRGSLISRLTSLTQGVLGDVLDVPQSIDFPSLLDRKVVIELEEVKDGEGKALMMGLILGGISEAIRQKHRMQPQFRHLTLVEEAHRLLSRPEPGDTARGNAVDEFANLLAEVRKYGEGLIIADQIPAKLIPDVIKNTHTKIVHRLFAEDDRRTMGEAMMMNDKQRDFLPNLGVGEAIVFCGGWHAPTHAKIRADRAQTDRPAPTDEDIARRAINQLWKERKRYYPLLSAYGFTGEAQQDLFARFVVEGRKALNHLLLINPQNTFHAQNQSNSARFKTMQEHHFRSLQQWVGKWQSLVPFDQQRWQGRTGLERPKLDLTSPLLALMLDSNPRPYTQAMNPPAWVVSMESFDWDLWQTALDGLLSQIMSAKNLEDFIQLPENPRVLKNALDELSNYQTF